MEINIYKLYDTETHIMIVSMIMNAQEQQNKKRIQEMKGLHTTLNFIS